MKTDEKLRIVTQMWGKKSYAEIAEAVGSTADSIRKFGRKHGLPPVRQTTQNTELTPEQAIEKDIKVGALSKNLKLTDSKYKVILRENEILQQQLEAVKVLDDINTYEIKAKPSGTKEATAVVVASDWHWAETVHASNVNGLNEYNTTIAKQRAERFFVNTVKLLEIFQAHSHIETLILALLGDFINGELREEAMQNNGELTMDELLGVSEALASGIKYLLDNTKVKLVIPCHSGNHARVTRKIHVATESGNSLEYVMYHMLARQFKGNKRVTFLIPTSYHSFLDVAGYTIRFSHGHAIRYAGGVGGIFIPVKKAIAQWNKAHKADLDAFAHFHQLRDGGDFVCNGSLIGWNEFANFIKADYEQPKQVFFLIDHQRKAKTVTTPIFLN